MSYKKLFLESKLLSTSITWSNVLKSNISMLVLPNALSPICLILFGNLIVVSIKSLHL